MADSGVLWAKKKIFKITFYCPTILYTCAVFWSQVVPYSLVFDVAVKIGDIVKCWHPVQISILHW